MIIIDKILKAIEYTLFIIAVILIVGTVGDLELDHIACGQAFIRGLIAVGCLMSGWFIHDGIRMHLDC